MLLHLSDDLLEHILYLLQRDGDWLSFAYATKFKACCKRCHSLLISPPVSMYEENMVELTWPLLASFTLQCDNKTVAAYDLDEAVLHHIPESAYSFSHKEKALCVYVVPLMNKFMWNVNRRWYVSSNFENTGMPKAKQRKVIQEKAAGAPETCHHTFLFKHTISISVSRAYDVVAPLLDSVFVNVYKLKLSSELSDEVLQSLAVSLPRTITHLILDASQFSDSMMKCLFTSHNFHHLYHLDLTSAHMSARSRKWFILYLANNTSLRELILTDVWLPITDGTMDYLSLIKALELSPVEYIETTFDINCSDEKGVLLLTDQYLRTKTRLWKSIVPRGLLCHPHELLIDHLPDYFQPFGSMEISEELDTKIQLRLQSILSELKEELDAIPVSVAAPVPAATTQKRKKSIREIYDERNHRRNQLLPEDRICKGCDTVWPAGSIKIQKFEGLQSKCARDVSKCCSSRDFHLAFPRED